jgi:hypothetical protein
LEDTIRGSSQLKIKSRELSPRRTRTKCIRRDRVSRATFTPAA